MAPSSARETIGKARRDSRSPTFLRLTHYNEAWQRSRSLRPLRPLRYQRGSAAPHGRHRHEVSIAGRHSGAARRAPRDGRRSDRTCPSRGGSCGGAARPSRTVRPAAATARASPTPKLRVPSIDTTTGPGASGELLVVRLAGACRPRWLGSGLATVLNEPGELLRDPARCR